MHGTHTFYYATLWVLLASGVMDSVQLTSALKIQRLCHDLDASRTPPLHVSRPGGTLLCSAYLQDLYDYCFCIPGLTAHVFKYALCCAQLP